MDGTIPRITLLARLNPPAQLGRDLKIPLAGSKVQSSTIVSAMNATAKVAKWADPPAMDSGAPIPTLYSDENGLTCAYVIGVTHPESGRTAILRFEGVLYYAMGYPNDEALNAHALYANGLAFYGFHVVENSPLIADFDHRNQVH
jgi:hypothetical protein